MLENMISGNNASSIKQNNRAMIMKTIQSENGISRIEISEKIGLTRGGVTPIVTDLIKLNLVEENETVETTNGRRPVNLRLNYRWIQVISVEWLRDRLVVSLVQINGVILRNLKFSFTGDETKEFIVSKMKEFIRELTRMCKDRFLVGIIVFAPGALNSEKGIILTPTNFHGWSNIPIVEILKEEFQVPVYLENNVVGHTIAEQYFAENQRDNFIYMIIDDGIGALLVLNGTLYKGEHGRVSEIGHTTLDIHGERCSCGNVGCAELYASIPAMCKRGLDNFDQMQQLDMKNQFHQFLETVNEGDERAVQAVRDEVRYVGEIIISLINIFVVDTVVIDSMLSMLGEKFLELVNCYVKNRIVHTNMARPKVVFSNIEYPAAVGGAIYVFDQFINGTMGTYEEVIAHNQNIFENKKVI